MRILLLVAIALLVVYALDRQTRRWLRSIGRALIGGGEATASRQHHGNPHRAKSRTTSPPARRQGRLVVCQTCGVRVADSLAELGSDGSIYCSAECRQRADGA